MYIIYHIHIIYIVRKYYGPQYQEKPTYNTKSMEKNNKNNMQCIIQIKKYVRLLKRFICSVLTGRGICSIHGILLLNAGSTSIGLFVAPMIKTLHLESVASPSHKLINWAFTIAVDSWSDASRDLRKASKNHLHSVRRNIYSDSEWRQYVLFTIAEKVTISKTKFNPHWLMYLLD